jgi:hypothetical protein
MTVFCGGFCLSVVGNSVADKETANKPAVLFPCTEFHPPPPYSPMTSIPHARPIASERRFVSASVEAILERVKDHFTQIGKRDWGLLFENVYPNTLGKRACHVLAIGSYLAHTRTDTTVMIASAKDSFIITGDIPAMWYVVFRA